MGERVIYIGPTLKGGKLNRYTVFIGGIPHYLSAEIEKYSGMEYLFVPTDRLVENEKELATVGSALYLIAEEIERGEFE